jgi:NADH-quinone oxidoreductase subunit J
MMLAAVAIDQVIVFVIAVAIVAVGAMGVIGAKHPVHAALSLVTTLFGVAVLFIEEGAEFLAAVQVVVYAGAVVVLFLFVIMLLGVDKVEMEPIAGSRKAVGLALLGVLLVLAEFFAVATGHFVTGAKSVAGKLTSGLNVAVLARAVFTTYVLPFELTAALLVIAVVGAVVLSRRMGERKGVNR